MTTGAHHETVILGAGPGGLAAACLGRRGVPYLLLEKGEAPCAALCKIHPGMTLVSPRPLSPGAPLREPGHARAVPTRHPLRPHLRLLRGIGRDAAYVARPIARRLESSPDR